MPDDVFADGLSSLSCAKVLANCLRKIERKVNELYTLHKDMKNSQIKGEKKLQSATESLDYLPTKFDTLEKECVSRMKKSGSLMKI